MKVLQLLVGELKSALTGFSKVVSSRTTLPALGCIRVESQPDGVNLQVTNLDSFATFKITTADPTHFPTCLVSLAALAKVAKTSKSPVSLISDGAEHLRLRQSIGTTSVEQSIDSLPIEDWPAIPQFQAKPFLVEPGFKEAFRNAMECASADSTRAILNGVCLDLTQPDCHCLVGTDGRHLFSANTFHFALTKSAIIPSRKFLNWSGFADDGDWLLAVEPPAEGATPKPAYIQIQSQHWTFLTRGIEGSYPNWRQIMPSPDRSFTTVKLAEEAIGLVLDALPRMPGFDESDQTVTVAIEAGKLFLRSRSRFVDQVAEIPVPGAMVSGPDQRVCLNRGFISKGLRFGFAELEVQDALSPVLFTGPGKKLLAAPVRFNDAPLPPHADPQDSQPSPQAITKTPAEGTEPAPPSAAQPDNPTEQKPAMETANNIATMPAPERGNLKPTTSNGHNGETPTAMKAVVESVERIKTNLRDVIGDLNDTLDLLKAAEKEKKATLKEVESIRATLRSLQKMEL